MDTQTKEYNSRLLDVIEELNTYRRYVIEETGVEILAMDINSLLYISLDSFISLVEFITKTSVPSAIHQWLETQVYVEDISNFVQTVRLGICTNFLEGKIFEDVREHAMVNGGRRHNEQNTASMGLNEDADLYRRILEDEEFLVKQLRKRPVLQVPQPMNPFKQNEYTGNGYSGNGFKEDYDSISNFRRQPRFSDNEVMSLKSQKIFSTAANIQDIFGLARMNAKTSDMGEFHLHQRQLINKGMVKPFCKPRGKQMESVDTTDRPFLCKVPGCNRAFKRFEHLKRHNKMHTGEKPFVCKFPGCNRGFSRSDNLNAHYKTHNISPKQIEHLNQKSNSHHHINFDSF